MKVNVQRQCKHCGGRGYKYEFTSTQEFMAAMFRPEDFRITCEYCGGTGKQLFETIEENKKVRYED